MKNEAKECGPIDILDVMECGESLDQPLPRRVQHNDCLQERCIPRSLTLAVVTRGRRSVQSKEAEFKTPSIQGMNR
jgi:hypothetical protein